MSDTSIAAEPLVWKDVPMKRDPKKGWIILSVALGALAFGIWTFQSGMLGLIGFAIIVLTTAEFWLGVRYEINSVGAKRKVGVSVTEMTWDAVKRIVWSDDSVLLSPLSQDGRLGPFRGVCLRFPAADRPRVLEALKIHGGEHVRGLV